MLFLDKFLQDNGLPILLDAGNVKHDESVDHAEQQYLSYEEKRRKAGDQDAEKQFLSDLHNSVKTVAARRRKK